MRTVKEWIGKTDDAKIPAAVRLRVFEKFGGKCALTGKKLQAGEFDLDHIISLADGGQHRESNLHPVWRPKHREKTAKENSARAVVRAKKIKHFEPKKQAKNPIRSAPFQSRLKPEKGSGPSPSHAAHLEKMKQKAGL